MIEETTDLQRHGVDRWRTCQPSSPPGSGCCPRGMAALTVTRLHTVDVDGT